MTGMWTYGMILGSRTWVPLFFMSMLVFMVFGATDVALGTVIQNSRRLVLLALQAVVAKPVLGQPNASLPRGPIR
ncbi:hypothetical protein V6N13_095582 [Hibiscus sabdariffa]